MKESASKKRPGYRLLKQGDVVSFFHMQMPRWLFCDKRYKTLSLESKVAYTFLLNRFQLSRMNNWVNSSGEVYIIFPREKLAEEIGISYRKAITCFKELLAAGLIWEQRPGRGHANRIYMAAVILSEEDAGEYEGAPFSPRDAENAGLDENFAEHEASPEGNGNQYLHLKECGGSSSCSADLVHSELQEPHTSKKDISNTDISNKESVSLSVVGDTARFERQADSDYDSDNLAELLEKSELYVLQGDDEAEVFRGVITRLFYSEKLRIGDAVLPREVIRSYLKRLDGTILLDTREKLRRNLDKPVKNSMGYIMAALLNNILEHKSDLMVDPFLNSLGAT